MVNKTQKNENKEKQKKKLKESKYSDLYTSILRDVVQMVKKLDFKYLSHEEESEHQFWDSKVLGKSWGFESLETKVNKIKLQFSLILEVRKENLIKEIKGDVSKLIIKQSPTEKKEKKLCRWFLSMLGQNMVHYQMASGSDIQVSDRKTDSDHEKHMICFKVFRIKIERNSSLN